MSASFIILAAITIASAVAAMTLRHLVHCALALAITFAGLAALYLQLDAQFVGFAQVLVYVGAVAILIVFAILLTRGSEAPQQSIFSSSWAVGGIIAAAVFAVLAVMIRKSRLSELVAPAGTTTTVREIGDRLMTT
ncbi:MAG TPA: NADH-quinone oxidoreductase subunit J, partial [Candidatus Dormibacteraeota bacterium]|nr:NADH-quinone oxidoreductase subunit J [Candidatus Dormibacteraeota bacterium]